MNQGSITVHQPLIYKPNVILSIKHAIVKMSNDAFVLMMGIIIRKDCLYNKKQFATHVIMEKHRNHQH